MPAFLARDTVEADLALHRDGAGGVTSATLTKQDGSGTVTLNNVCLWPDGQNSALGGGGLPGRHCDFTFWRLGEADFPKPDDTVTVNLIGGGTATWQVGALVGKRFSFDEGNGGYGVYDYTFKRAI